MIHRGRMNKETQSLRVTILEESGSGELQSISGSMEITQDETGHNYKFSYEF